MIETQMSLGAAIEHSFRRLQGLGDSALLDAQVLVAHAANRSRTWVIAHPESQLDLAQWAGLQDALAQLEGGTPLPYVIGKREFFGLEFTVTPEVLIPRPETEHLVEAALGWLEAHPHASRLIDVGTGSGCIAVSVARHLPHTQWIASDISIPALKIARKNIHRHGLSHQISLLACSLLDAVPGEFDLICANLPYIPAVKLASLKVSESEPALALDGGESGLELVRRLLQQAARHLAVPGLLLAEIEASQGSAVCSLARKFFPGAKIKLLQDLAGHDRILQVELEVVKSHLEF